MKVIRRIAARLKYNIRECFDLGKNSHSPEFRKTGRGYTMRENAFVGVRRALSLNPSATSKKYFKLKFP